MRTTTRTRRVICLMPSVYAKRVCLANEYLIHHLIVCCQQITIFIKPLVYASRSLGCSSRETILTQVKPSHAKPCQAMPSHAKAKPSQAKSYQDERVEISGFAVITELSN